MAETRLGATQDQIADFSTAEADGIDLCAPSDGPDFITSAFIGAASEARFDTATATPPIDFDTMGRAMGRSNFWLAP